MPPGGDQRRDPGRPGDVPEPGAERLGREAGVDRALVRDQAQRQGDRGGQQGDGGAGGGGAEQRPRGEPLEPAAQAARGARARRRRAARTRPRARRSSAPAAVRGSRGRARARPSRSSRDSATGTGSGGGSRGASSQTAASATITIATATPPTRTAVERGKRGVSRAAPPSSRLDRGVAEPRRPRGACLDPAGLIAAYDRPPPSGGTNAPRAALGHPLEPPRPRGGPRRPRGGPGRRDLVPGRRRRLRRPARRVRRPGPRALLGLPGRQPRPRRARAARHLDLLARRPRRRSTGPGSG